MLAELVARPYCLFRGCNKICLNYHISPRSFKETVFYVPDVEQESSKF